MGNIDEYQLLIAANAPEDLKEVTEQLELHGIPFKVEKAPTAFDPTFAFKAQVGNLRVWVKEEHFENARRAMEEIDMLVQPDADAPSEFFGDFTEEELQDVLIKPDEWGADQVAMAQMELKKRGLEINVPTIKAARQARVEEARKPRTPSPFLYLVMLLAMASPIGLVLAYWVAFGSGKDPAGKQFYLYSKRSRKIAVIIGAIGIVSWVVFFYLASIGKIEFG